LKELRITKKKEEEKQKKKKKKNVMVTGMQVSILAVPHPYRWVSVLPLLPGL
jgi:hypothetical protein